MKRGTPPAINQGRPTTAELGALWEKLSALPSNRFSVSSINKAVEELVKAKKVRPAIAPVVKAYAVYAEDLMRRRDEPIDPVRAAKGVEERYFLGGVSEAETPEERSLLRAARTGEKPEVKRTPIDRPMRSIGIPKDAEEFLRRSLQTPAGRKLTEATVRYQQRKEGKPSVKNPLSRIRPRALRPTSAEKPYVSKGSALAEREAKAKYVGNNVGSRAQTKSGKPIFFRFKDSGRPQYFSMDKLKEVLGPGGADVLTGMGPLEKSVYARLNELAKKGSARAALRAAVLRSRGYKTGERFERAQQTTREQVWKPPNERGEFKPVMKGGKPVLRLQTPTEKARKRARNESRAMGMTPSEEAKSVQRGKREGGPSVERVKTVEEKIKQGVEDRIRKGRHGPLQREAFQKLQALKEQELARYSPEDLEELRRSARIRTRPDSPKTSRERSDEIARARAGKTPSLALQKIDRLNRIIVAHGATPYDPMVSPKLPPGKVFKYRPTQGPIPPRGYYSKGGKVR